MNATHFCFVHSVHSFCFSGLNQSRSQYSSNGIEIERTIDVKSTSFSRSFRIKRHHAQRRPNIPEVFVDVFLFVHLIIYLLFQFLFVFVLAAPNHPTNPPMLWLIFMVGFKVSGGETEFESISLRRR